MKKTLPILLMGFLLIILVDGIGAIVSRQWNFNIGYLMPFSMLIYTAIPFVITKRGDKKAAIISGAILGLFDATIGFKWSSWLGANTGSAPIMQTSSVVITSLFLLMGISTLLGLLGSALAVQFSNQYKKT
jgi:hypothetical protein